MSENGASPVLTPCMNAPLWRLLGNGMHRPCGVATEVVLGAVCNVHALVVGRVTPAAAHAGETFWDVSFHGAGCNNALEAVRQVCSARPCVLAALRKSDENGDAIVSLLIGCGPVFFWDGVGQRPREGWPMPRS